MLAIMRTEPSLFKVFRELVDIESRQSKYDSVGKQITTRSLKCLFICSTSRNSFITSPTAFLMGGKKDAFTFISITILCQGKQLIYVTELLPYASRNSSQDCGHKSTFSDFVFKRLKSTVSFGREYGPIVHASGECEVSPTSRPCSRERCKQTYFPPCPLMTLRPWGVCWCQGTHCRSAIRQGSINREEVLLIQFGSSYGVLLRLQISAKSLEEVWYLYPTAIQPSYRSTAIF